MKKDEKKAKREKGVAARAGRRAKAEKEEETAEERKVVKGMGAASLAEQGSRRERVEGGRGR